MDAAAAGIYTHGVKPLDFNDTEFITNVAHKLAAGLTGCLSAKAKDQSCEAAAVGAIIGEMVGDWMSNAHEVTLPDGEKVLILSDEDKQKILNTAKLAAGSIALLYDFDVDTAANEALVAVRWNATGKHPQQHRNTKRDIFGENSAIAKFGDMIITNVSGSIYGYTMVINAKNGKVYATDKFEVSASSSILTGVATSINFGNVIGGNYSADDLDKIIAGSSFNMQACYTACAGISKTQTNTIVTYGVGTPQIGMSGGSLKYTGLQLSQADINQLSLKSK
ncbi:hypothetical protein MOVS_09220 [Moraxella ovis]|uniref:Possible hemagglutinin (DUF638) n=1 Tax=Moraxella ovis TaxID=29433 RepID=A0A378PND7_9GAMM|nr:VENN motif pre-toxin domain-containing protein [Moraxella ovis]ANB92123.1 hypothetical protein MOVS_09220 [Moraxella ovis]STY87896.1 Possible hemagglutinin (DUF638) [Moraxella ovis]